MCTREICKRCGKESAVGFSVPDAMWEVVTGGRWNVLCLACFTLLADQERLPWDRHIQFYPVALATAEQFS